MLKPPSWLMVSFKGSISSQTVKVPHTVENFNVINNKQGWMKILTLYNTPHKRNGHKYINQNPKRTNFFLAEI